MHNDRALDAGAVSSLTVFYGYLPISVAVRAVWAAQALCTFVSEWACGIYVDQGTVGKLSSQAFQRCLGRKSTPRRYGTRSQRLIYGQAYS